MSNETPGVKPFFVQKKSDTADKMAEEILARQQAAEKNRGKLSTAEKQAHTEFTAKVSQAREKVVERKVKFSIYISEKELEKLDEEVTQEKIRRLSSNRGDVSRNDIILEAISEKIINMRNNNAKTA